MSNIQLLVVDDPELVLVLQPTFVRRAGVRILTGRDADETLAKALAHSPDVLVLDGEGWGAECCRRLKLDPRISETPVILLGAGPHTAVGADAVVPRPVETRKLLETIRRFVVLPERTGPRRRASIEVTFFDGEDERRALTKDVSGDGLFLSFDAPPAAGRELRLVFDLPGGSDSTIRATACVVRSVGPERDSHLLPGAALRLIEIGERDRAALARFAAAEG